MKDSEDLIIYTQFGKHGTVRMSLHKFDAPFGYTDAPAGFRFEYRVVTKARNLPFRPSCYFPGWRDSYSRSSFQKARATWCDTRAGTKRKIKAEIASEFEAIQWLLEGEE